MPNYKLHYFNLKGRAEVIRLILAHGNFAYEDVRIERGDWLNQKPSKEYIVFNFDYITCFYRVYIILIYAYHQTVDRIPVWSSSCA